MALPCFYILWVLCSLSHCYSSYILRNHRHPFFKKTKKGEVNGRK
jgi:hypothetical protein